jgi:hypothetical protein
VNRPDRIRSRWKSESGFTADCWGRVKEDSWERGKRIEESQPRNSLKSLKNRGEDFGGLDQEDEMHESLFNRRARRARRLRGPGPDQWESGGLSGRAGGWPGQPVLERRNCQRMGPIREIESISINKTAAPSVGEQGAMRAARTPHVARHAVSSVAVEMGQKVSVYPPFAG